LASSLRQDLRLEAAVSVPGRGDLDGAERGSDAFLAFAVTPVGSRVLVEMGVEIGLQALLYA